MSATRAADVKRAGARKSYRPPGLVIAIVTLLAVCLLLCLYYGWWPSRFGSLRWAEPLLFCAGALLTLGVVGLVWVIRTLIYAVEERRWSWRILVAPAIVLGAVALSAALRPTSFDEMRPEFEQAAHDLLASPDSARENLEIGRFDIYQAFEGRDGEVYFEEASWFSFGTSTGWVYSPNGEPAGFDDFSSTPLGGSWYEYESVWRD
ncbi:DUF1109 domain-containing protein [Prescottella agglutinans]|uniref:DUF1109 domain-containing protein n=1 Tax=Prescottella agglutinans TaxID=1644129 RepID=A0ABT6M484_9NOCA|nr:DUF1109 domain-containing protein [Prescottella agglutinans]MDH6279127.1 hypothetical protein [Prescottella agglutinans]